MLITAPKIPSTLVGSGSSPASPLLDGFVGWPEAPGSLGRPGTWPMVMQSDRSRKGGGNGSDYDLAPITTDLL
jgi:hypothetical protein